MRQGPVEGEPAAPSWKVMPGWERAAEGMIWYNTEEKCYERVTRIDGGTVYTVMIYVNASDVPADRDPSREIDEPDFDVDRKIQSGTYIVIKGDTRGGVG